MVSYRTENIACNGIGRAKYPGFLRGISNCCFSRQQETVSNLFSGPGGRTGKAAPDLTHEAPQDSDVTVHLAKGGTCCCSISFGVSAYFINIFSPFFLYQQ